MKQLRVIQIMVIGAGTLFAWYTIVSDFIRFYNIEGTVFRLDCPTVNPVKTACFYGGIGFLVAIVWSIKISRMEQVKLVKHQLYLTLFLIAGNIFGWFNFTRGYLKFINAAGKPVVGCSGQIMTNPFTTPCFYGSLFFLVALLVATATYLWFRGVRKNHTDELRH